MLKKRIVVSLLINDGVLFRTKKFVPDYRYTTSFLATEAVDEVFLIDITRSGSSAASREAMKAYAERCFTPITMGGWVDSLEKVRDFMAMGADKVVLGRAAIENPGLITKIAEKYGSQAVVVACDVKNGTVCIARSEHLLPWSPMPPAKFAEQAENAGAGEIFLQSVDRDGSLAGYDIDTLEKVVAEVGIPVVVGGGCGSWLHMAQAFDAGADGAATGVIHHLTETSLRGFKQQLARNGQAVRL